jgi:hypothetical protein
MGFRLKLISDSQKIIAATEQSFSRFGRARAVEPPDFTFRLFGHDLDVGRAGPPLFYRDGPLLYQTTGRDSTLVADLATGLAYGHFSATTLANPAYFRWHFLELAFFQLLESRGFMGVHAAAVVKDDRAILLRAQSGAGKTTLTYAAARHRLQALAEDVVWLDVTGQRWWGMPWSFHLLPDAKSLFPELAPYEPVLQTNQEMKLEVNMETIRPGSTRPWGLPQAVLFLERLAGGTSRLEAIDLPVARSLWPEARTGLEMKLPHHAGQIERLLSVNPLYRLYLGDDLDRAVALVESLLN